MHSYFCINTSAECSLWGGVALGYRTGQQVLTQLLVATREVNYLLCIHLHQSRRNMNTRTPGSKEKGGSCLASLGFWGTGSVLCSGHPSAGLSLQRHKQVKRVLHKSTSKALLQQQNPAAIKTQVQGWLRYIKMHPGMLGILYSLQ